jgi:hypothetical protein
MSEHNNKYSLHYTSSGGLDGMLTRFSISILLQIRRVQDWMNMIDERYVRYSLDRLFLTSGHLTEAKYNDFAHKYENGGFAMPD